MEAVADTILECSVWQDVGMFQLYAVVIIGLAVMALSAWKSANA